MDRSEGCVVRDGKSDSETAATELAERVNRIAELAKARDLRERGVRGDRQMDLIEEGEDG